VSLAPDNGRAASPHLTIEGLPLGGTINMKIRGLTLLAALVVAPAALRAQDLMKEALASFPPATIRLEYSNPAKLRTLPDYGALRQRYMGPSLQNLEQYLAKLGIQEKDIDETVLAWQSAGSGLELEGLAAGELDPAEIARHATQQGIAATPIEGQSAYCFGSEQNSPCVITLKRNLGAFGPLSLLTALVQARAGETPALSSNTSFDALIEQGHPDAPIWGVATGPAVTDWFKGWMPKQQNMQLDWSGAFQSVESLVYNVQPQDNVHLNAQLNCADSQSAGNLRQVLDGLSRLQKLAWQTQNPGQPNPFDNLAVNADGSQVLMTLSTSYQTLEAGALPQQP
jgi:hypothetical protein